MTYFDLTHKIHKEIPNWVGSCGYHLKQYTTYEESGFDIKEINFIPSSAGTHMDAPLHRVKGGRDIADFSLADLIAPLRVFDFSEICEEDTLISLNDFIKKESELGKIHKGDFILFQTGWGQYWDNPKLYRAEDENEVKHFPAIAKEVASYLISKNISAIGIDTLSPDTGQYDFPVHDIILQADKLIVENVLIPDNLPHSGCTIYVMPPPFTGASESPVRLIAKSA